MAATGADEAQFWSQTPRQTDRAVKAAIKRHEAEEQSRRWHTWHVAALGNAKKLPTFAEFAAPVRPETASPPSAARQSTEAQMAALKSIFDRRNRQG